MQNELVIHSLFNQTASLNADNVAFEIGGAAVPRQIKYRELNSRSKRIAAFLLKEGFKKGDFAVLISENGPLWSAVYLGMMYAGLTCVPLDCQLTPQEINNLISDSSAGIIFCSAKVYEDKFKRDLAAYTRKFIILEQLDGLIEKITDEQVFAQASPDDVASLIYTSGTTALPKGVLLTHKNICSNFRSIEELAICYPSDNFLSILPLHHTYAFMVTLIVPLLLGARITYSSSLKSAELTRMIRESGVTILVAVPQLIALIHNAIYERLKKIPSFLRPVLLPLIRKGLKKAFGKLRMVVSGGARLESQTNRDLARLGFKVIEGYGLTETSPIAALNPAQKTKFGSVGRPIPGVEIKISDPDESRCGEVLIKGPNVMKGYFKHPELTEAVIKEGWFYSGDLGCVDKDGYLFLTGRKKDVIVLSSGKNIYPEELEEYYGKSPYIKEICVLERKVEKFGHPVELLYAVIVPNFEVFNRQKIMDIRGKLLWELEELAAKLPSYKHIMGFAISKEGLPRTALKKIKRYEVRKIYIDQKSHEDGIKPSEISPQDREMLSGERAQKILKYISAQLKKPVSLDSHLEIDLGIDSLSRVELGLGLESVLKINIPDEVFYSASTIRDVVAGIINLSAEPEGAEEKGALKEWGDILNELPEENELLKKVRLKTGFLDKAFIFISQGILLLIFKIFWRLKIKGRENLPKEGPYLICPNHASYLDGFVVFAGVPFGVALKLYSMGLSAILEHSSVRWALKACHLIPVDPSLNLIQALQYVSFVLKNKKIAVIFPEGRRSAGSSVGEFKKGVGILIKELDIPVVPVYIKGSYDSWPRGNRLPRLCRLEIIFGKAFLARKEDDYQAIAQNLREEVLKLKQ